jgi:hypothetical protein
MRRQAPKASSSRLRGQWPLFNRLEDDHHPRSPAFPHPTQCRPAGALCRRCDPPNRSDLRQAAVHLALDLPGSTTARSPQAVLRTTRLAPGLLPIKIRLSNRYGASTRTFYLRLQNPKPVLSGLGLSTTSPVLGSLLRAAPTVSGRPPLTYRWTLDGRALSAEPTLAWEVAGVSAGPHTLALRVSNASGSAFLARTITVLQPLIRDFRPVCPNLLCLFPIDTAVAFELVLDPAAQPVRYEYDWIGSGAFTESSSAPISLHIYTEPGNYRPRVRITTEHGSEIRLASQFLLVTR